MQNLRFVLITLSVTAIIMLIIHALIINSRENSKLFCNNKDINNKKNKTNTVFDKNKSIKTPFYCEKSKIKEKQITEFNEELLNESKKIKLFKSVKKSNNSMLQNKNANNNIKSEFLEDSSSTNSKETFLILHVAAHKGRVLHGDIILQSIIQIGFKFGNMKIFHRHVNLSGTGPVLFSLVNMVKPGSFDLENMFEFTTPGISIFMMIPCYGEPEQNFKLMLQATQCIASDTGGIVLDYNRKILTHQKIKSYYKKIKNILS